jgi:hypothetical protein
VDKADNALREETMELDVAAMRKVALRFLPLLGLCYTINVLDRFNVSVAALTMNKALGLSATTYGLGAGDRHRDLRHCPFPFGDGRSGVLSRSCLLHDLLVPVALSRPRDGGVLCGRRFGRHSRWPGIG